MGLGLGEELGGWRGEGKGDAEGEAERVERARLEWEEAEERRGDWEEERLKEGWAVSGAGSSSRDADMMLSRPRTLTHAHVSHDAASESEPHHRRPMAA